MEIEESVYNVDNMSFYNVDTIEKLLDTNEKIGNKVAELFPIKEDDEDGVEEEEEEVRRGGGRGERRRRERKERRLNHRHVDVDCVDDDDAAAAEEEEEDQQSSIPPPDSLEKEEERGGGVGGSGGGLNRITYATRQVADMIDTTRSNNNNHIDIDIDDIVGSGNGSGNGSGSFEDVEIEQSRREKERAEEMKRRVMEKMSRNNNNNNNISIPTAAVVASSSSSNRRSPPVFNTSMDKILGKRQDKVNMIRSLEVKLARNFTSDNNIFLEAYNRLEKISIYLDDDELDRRLEELQNQDEQNMCQSLSNSTIKLIGIIFNKGIIMAHNKRSALAATKNGGSSSSGSGNTANSMMKRDLVLKSIANAPMENIQYELTKYISTSVSKNHKSAAKILADIIPIACIVLSHVLEMDNYQQQQQQQTTVVVVENGNNNNINSNNDGRDKFVDVD